MKFKTWGDKNNKTIVLLHGGGLSWWSFQPVIDLLETEYHIVAAIIDGHGESSDKTFVSIENSANKVIYYIENALDGGVFAIAGLSIGAQIAVDIISKRKNITQYAVLESALVLPIKSLNKATIFTINISYGLIRKKWFSRWQAKALSLPIDMYNLYYNDSLKISKQSLINISISNANYTLNDSVADTDAKILIIAGEKEPAMIRKSAEELHEKINNSKLYIAKGKKHGELSIVYPDEYVKLLTSFFQNSLPAL